MCLIIMSMLHCRVTSGHWWHIWAHRCYFPYTVFTRACHWDFCKHMPCTLTRTVTYLVNYFKKFSTFLLPIKFLNRFSVPLGMQSWTEGRYFIAFQMDQPTFCLHHTRSNETFSMELANLRLSNPNANHSLWLGRSHTKVMIRIYFEMKTYSKFLHEMDFVLRKISHANSEWFSCEQCICNTKLCVRDFTTALISLW